MKKLLFIFLIIFSSQSFAKSVVGKVLLCKGAVLELTYGYEFLDEKYAQEIRVDNEMVLFFKLQYETDLRKINIHVGNDSIIQIYRASLKTNLGHQCSIQKSKEIVVEYFREKLKEIMDSNQL